MVTAIAFSIGLALTTIFFAHYAAPAASLIVALAVQGLRHLRVWDRSERRTGLFLSRVLIVICVLMLPLQAKMLARFPAPGTWQAMGKQRSALAAELNALPGSHLVLVRYKANHDPRAEWVYNAANIDGSKVVWARDMGPATNEELIRYYPNRRVWLLEADSAVPRLVMYADANPQNSFFHGGRGNVPLVARAVRNMPKCEASALEPRRECLSQ